MTKSIDVVAERSLWQESFDRLLKFASEGPFEKEIVRAKELFFAKLGRAHEVHEELYEISSHSFLEWYLFNYITRPFHKTPAVVYTTLGLDSEIYTSVIERSLFNHWSIYEVLEHKKDFIYLKDLLYGRTRRLFYQPDFQVFKSWKVKAKQMVQARLFPFSDQQSHFLTHLWLHPKSETDLLKKIGQSRQRRWTTHEDLLVASFETAVRGRGLESQFAVSQASHWNYKELWKKYA
jgi:hypothetical protein